MVTSFPYLAFLFKKEIAPRSGLLRVREFCMGEIEHFVNPKDKSHPNFSSVKDKELVLFGREDQLGSGKTKTLQVGEAVKTGLINNETLAYFMARTQLYMEKIGMDPKRLRFRQHLATEMAHYAADCWDLEIQSSYGWIECVGHADRACYDLDVHGKATKTPMVATVKVNPPQQIEIAKLTFDRKALGQAFKKDQRVVSSALETLAEDWSSFEPIATALETEGKAVVDGYEITKDLLSWEKASKNVHEIKFTPSVIEPSFGIGRILYSLLEHSFYQRESDDQRCVMRFTPQVAPNKCAVLPISNSPETNLVVRPMSCFCCFRLDLVSQLHFSCWVATQVDEIAAELMDNDISTRVDKSSATLGRRYARADELGVPFAVTVDFDTLKDGTVTLRERDSTRQIRLPKADVAPSMFAIIHNKLTWEQMNKKYPVVEVDDGEGGGTTGEEVGAATKVVNTGRGRFSRPAGAP